MMRRREFLLIAGGAALRATMPEPARAAETAGAPETAADVCVYGGTAAGVVAAVAAAREGCRVVIVEPSRWLGGMTGGGLSHIDWGRPEAVGGVTRTLLKDGRSDPEYRRAFAELVKAHSIPVVFEHRLGSVVRDGTAVRAVTLDHAPPDRLGCPVAAPTKAAAVAVAAKVFIDCTYEGDLMARAGVSYTFGRESSAQYGESLAGVRPELAVYRIDPYRNPGDPKSGLIPLLQDYRPGRLGGADRLTMGYGFRWKFSTAADRLPIDPPEGYDPAMFELYRRGFKAGVNMAQGRKMHVLGKYEPEGGNMFKPGAGNLSRGLWAPAVYGSNADYPDGDYAARARIWKFHQDFLRGMTHFLRTDPSVPAGLRKQAEGVGFGPGQFDDTAGYPHQLYVREARRMKSGYVVTQKDLEGGTDPDDPVGLASYGVDDWPYATHPHADGVALQGGEFSILYLTERNRGIYRIPFRAIVPAKAECANLLVPVCCSASHIAMTSIRMEPVWMILGESAGVAAAMAVRGKSAVQDVAYPALRQKLLALGQRLDPAIPAEPVAK
jgi:hypothetical protein